MIKYNLKSILNNDLFYFLMYDLFLYFKEVFRAPFINATPHRVVWLCGISFRIFFHFYQLFYSYCSKNFSVLFFLGLTKHGLLSSIFNIKVTFNIRRSNGDIKSEDIQTFSYLFQLFLLHHGVLFPQPLFLIWQHLVLLVFWQPFLDDLGL